MFQSMLRPGQGFQKFDVLSEREGLAANGRPKPETVHIGEIIGMLMIASHGELMQWRGQEKNKQEAHAVLYKIIHPGANTLQIKPTDVLLLGERRFTVKGIHNPAGLNRFTTYFAEEREDLQ